MMSHGAVMKRQPSVLSINKNMHINEDLDKVKSPNNQQRIRRRRGTSVVIAEEING